MDRRFLTANGVPAGGGWLARALAVAGGVAVMVGLALVSVVAAAVLLVAGGVVWAVIWWKTRHLRRAMRKGTENAPEAARWYAQEDSEHLVLEGDFIREVKDAEDADEANSTRA